LNEVGDPYTLSLRYEPAREDEIRFLHQPFVVWKKRATRSPTSER
jgi:hypothetical protein